MVESKESGTQSSTFRENDNIHEETKTTGEKDVVLLQNETRKKSASQKRRKESVAPCSKTDIAELREASDKIENQYADDMLLDKMESLDVYEDGQGAPLSLKNFFKAVKSFSKRKPKIPKVPEETTKEKKETDVVVFERLATPRSFYKSRRVSRSLPPIMDIHDILSNEVQAEGEILGRGPNCLPSEEARTWSIEGIHSTLTRSGPSVQPPAISEKELRRYRCSRLLHELEPDGLQEFGSLDASLGNRGRDYRVSRKSLGYLRNTHEEHEALHF